MTRVDFTELDVVRAVAGRLLEGVEKIDARIDNAGLFDGDSGLGAQVMGPS